ncbi:uncharacterized protein OCT59_016406 [Rhizophagus irregularis]|uniref:uncharacterized protein n=1 Tax=Rhizophagus irregularis TaxID=588596 RepID=UPI0033211315|nr:hypothetical protein OCT59_016406 [Rhizophagus irregularis]
MDSFFIQKPDENTNMFIDFRTALLAMYTFLTGDSSALSNWLYLDNQAIWFKFLTLEIEVIYYYANVDRTREEIKRLISRDEWNADAFPEMKKDLFKKTRYFKFKD